LNVVLFLSLFFRYYEGGNGWWRFEERHSDEIEAAFQAGSNLRFTLLVN